MHTIDADLNEVRLRLSKLYEALETGKLSLDDLAPRIKELKAREGELSKARLQVEAETLLQGANHVNAEMIKAHARDLKAILEEADLIASKAFLRTFIKRIDVKHNEAMIRYALPMPPQGKTSDTVSVLPIDTLSGAIITFPHEKVNAFFEIKMAHIPRAGGNEPWFKGIHGH